MKNRKRNLILTLALFGTLSAALGMAACGKGCAKKENDEKTSSLPAPEVTATNDGVFWAEVQTAEEYRYKWNETDEWTETTTCKADYPTTVGSYTLYVEAMVDGDAGRTTQFPLEVKTFAVTCTQVDNTLAFAGDNIYYSVNGGEEAKLDESMILDFTAGTVGTTYSVEYYSKGGVWSNEEKAYYIDGEKKTVSLTVTQMLSAPVLRVNNTGTGLVWTADANAEKYEVVIDGQTQEISASESSVAFPTGIGEHLIQVRALGTGGYLASREAQFTFETKEFGVPSVSYDQDTGNVTWDEKFNGWMQVSVDGGAFTLASDNATPFAEDTKVKLAAGYSVAENVYYLESKTLGFAKRETPTVKFDKDGVLTWNETDEGVEKTYFISLETEGEVFGASAANTLNVSGAQVGDYVFKVYAGQYLDEGANSAMLYLPSDVATLTFGILPSPELDFTTGKLLWTVDARAASYEYKIGDGEWMTAEEIGYAEVINLETYSVRAIGSNAAPYYVTAKTVSIRFDPKLERNEAEGWEMMATFDDEKYMSQIANPVNTSNQTATGEKQIIFTGATAEEQAILDGATGGVLKLTAGSAKGRNVNVWGNADGFSVELFKDYDPQDGVKITFRVYMVSNQNRTTDGWKADKELNHIATDLEGKIIFGVSGPKKDEPTVFIGNEDWPTILTDEWVEYTVDITNAAYSDKFSVAKYVNVIFQDNGQAGDVIYVDYIRSSFIPRATLKTIDFDENPDMVQSFSMESKTSLVEDEIGGETKTVAKLSGHWKKDGAWKYYFNHIPLLPGSQVSITMRVETTATNGGEIMINGEYRKDFTSDQAYQTYDVVIQQELELFTLEFKAYNPSTTYNLYIAKIVIKEAVQLTDYTSIDFEQLGWRTTNAFGYSEKGEHSSYDEEEKAFALKNYFVYNGNAKNSFFFTYPANGENAITIQAGMQITVVMKAEQLSGTDTKSRNAGLILNASGLQAVDGTWVTNTPNLLVAGESTGWQTKTFTFDATAHAAFIGQTLTMIQLKPYVESNISYNVYVQSIVITVPEA